MKNRKNRKKEKKGKRIYNNISHYFRMNLLRRLQQMKLTDREVNEAIEWIKDGDIPPPYRDQFRGFIVRDDKLIYEPQNLE